MISNEEILNKWKSPLYKGRGYVLWESTQHEQKSRLTRLLISKYMESNKDTILYVSMHTNKSVEITNQIKSLRLSEVDGLVMKQDCGLVIIDTSDMSIEQIKQIVDRISFRFAMVYANIQDDVRYSIQVDLLNIVPYKLVNSQLKVELTGIDKSQYDKYTDYISEKMALFNVPEDELMALPGITNTFELIQACAVGRDGQIASYYRRYLAELLGWSSDMDTSIDYMREIDESFNPHTIGETSNIIMGSVRGRGDILKNSADKRKVIVNAINNNLGKSIVVIAPSAQMAEDINIRLAADGINNGLFHNYIKGRTIIDEDTGKPILYKSGKQAGYPKVFGATVIKRNSIDDYNDFKHNILITFGKLDDTFRPNRVDVIIIANLNVEYDNVFYNANFIFPTNKTIEIIYIYTDEKKEVHKLKNFMYNNGIKQSKKRGIHRNM